LIIVVANVDGAGVIEATKRHTRQVEGAMCNGAVQVQLIRLLRVEKAEAILLRT